MRISKGLGRPSPLDVYFDDDDPEAILKITYRPSSFTVAELDEIRSTAEKNPKRLIESILNIVIEWDLTDDDGETPVPLTLDGIYGVVPSSILTGIIKAVNEDQTPSGK